MPGEYVVRHATSLKQNSQMTATSQAVESNGKLVSPIQENQGSFQNANSNNSYGSNQSRAQMKHTNGKSSTNTQNIAEVTSTQENTKSTELDECREQITKMIGLHELRDERNLTISQVRTGNSPHNTDRISTTFVPRREFKTPNAPARPSVRTKDVTKRKPDQNQVTFTKSPTPAAAVGRDFIEFIQSPRVPDQFDEEEDQEEAKKFWVCDPEVYKKDQESRKANVVQSSKIAKINGRQSLIPSAKEGRLLCQAVGANGKTNANPIIQIPLGSVVPSPGHVVVSAVQGKHTVVYRNAIIQKGPQVAALPVNGNAVCSIPVTVYQQQRGKGLSEQQLLPTNIAHVAFGSSRVQAINSNTQNAIKQQPSLTGTKKPGDDDEAMLKIVSCYSLNPRKLNEPTNGTSTPTTNTSKSFSMSDVVKSTWRRKPDPSPRLSEAKLLSSNQVAGDGGKVIKRPQSTSSYDDSITKAIEKAKASAGMQDSPDDVKRSDSASSSSKASRDRSRNRSTESNTPKQNARMSAKSTAKRRPSSSLESWFSSKQTTSLDMHVVGNYPSPIIISKKPPTKGSTPGTSPAFRPLKVASISSVATISSSGAFKIISKKTELPNASRVGANFAANNVTVVQSVPASSAAFSVQTAKAFRRIAQPSRGVMSAEARFNRAPQAPVGSRPRFLASIDQATRPPPSYNSALHAVFRERAPQSPRQFGPRFPMPATRSVNDLGTQPAPQICCNDVSQSNNASTKKVIGENAAKTPAEQDATLASESSSAEAPDEPLDYSMATLMKFERGCFSPEQECALDLSVRRNVGTCSIPSQLPESEVSKAGSTIPTVSDGARTSSSTAVKSEGRVDLSNLETLCSVALSSTFGVNPVERKKPRTTFQMSEKNDNTSDKRQISSEKRLSKPTEGNSPDLDFSEAERDRKTASPEKEPAIGSYLEVTGRETRTDETRSEVAVKEKGKDSYLVSSTESPASNVGLSSPESRMKDLNSTSEGSAEKSLDKSLEEPTSTLPNKAFEVEISGEHPNYERDDLENSSVRSDREVQAQSSSNEVELERDGCSGSSGSQSDHRVGATRAARSKETFEVDVVGHEAEEEFKAKSAEVPSQVTTEGSEDGENPKSDDNIDPQQSKLVEDWHIYSTDGAVSGLPEKVETKEAAVEEKSVGYAVEIEGASGKSEVAKSIDEVVLSENALQTTDIEMADSSKKLEGKLEKPQVRAVDSDPPKGYDEHETAYTGSTESVADVDEKKMTEGEKAPQLTREETQVNETNSPNLTDVNGREGNDITSHRKALLDNISKGRNSPNVTLLRLNSDEMRNNFSVRSENEVINIRPESLKTIIKIKMKKGRFKAIEVPRTTGGQRPGEKKVNVPDSVFEEKSGFKQDVKDDLPRSASAIAGTPACSARGESGMSKPDRGTDALKERLPGEIHGRRDAEAVELKTQDSKISLQQGKADEMEQKDDMKNDETAKCNARDVESAACVEDRKAEETFEVGKQCLREGIENELLIASSEGRETEQQEGDKENLDPDGLFFGIRSPTKKHFPHQKGFLESQELLEMSEACCDEYDNMFLTEDESDEEADKFPIEPTKLTDCEPEGKSEVNSLEDKDACFAQSVEDQENAASGVGEEKRDDYSKETQLDFGIDGSSTEPNETSEELLPTKAPFGKFSENGKTGELEADGSDDVAGDIEGGTAEGPSSSAQDGEEEQERPKSVAPIEVKEEWADHEAKLDQPSLSISSAASPQPLKVPQANQKKFGYGVTSPPVRRIGYNINADLSGHDIKIKRRKLVKKDDSSSELKTTKESKPSSFSSILLSDSSDSSDEIDFIKTKISRKKFRRPRRLSGRPISSIPEESAVEATGTMLRETSQDPVHLGLSAKESVESSVSPVEETPRGSQEKADSSAKNTLTRREPRRKRKVETSLPTTRRAKRTRGSGNEAGKRKVSRLQKVAGAIKSKYSKATKKSTEAVTKSTQLNITCPESQDIPVRAPSVNPKKLEESDASSSNSMIRGTPPPSRFHDSVSTFESASLMSTLSPANSEDSDISTPNAISLKSFVRDPFSPECEFGEITAGGSSTKEVEANAESAAKKIPRKRRSVKRKNNNIPKKKPKYQTHAVKSMKGIQIHTKSVKKAPRASKFHHDTCFGDVSLKDVVDEIIRSAPTKPKKSVIENVENLSKKMALVAKTATAPVFNLKSYAMKTSKPSEKNTIRTNASRASEKITDGMKASNPSEKGSCMEKTSKHFENGTARIKGNWKTTKLNDVDKISTQPLTFFRQPVLSKAKRDETIYLTMQKLLNMGLIMDQMPRREVPAISWTSSLEMINVGEQDDGVTFVADDRALHSSKALLPPTSNPPFSPTVIPEEATSVMKRELPPFSPEHFELKACYVMLERLNLRS